MTAKRIHRQRTVEQGLPFEFVQLQPNVHRVIYRDVKAGWEAWVLLSSDRHHDNALTDRELERQHLECLKARHGLGLDFGDLFDAMQQKGDPRSRKNEIRPEDNGDNYFDLIVEHAADFYAPYARWLKLFGRGNHESSALNHHGIDLTSNLVHRINTHEARSGQAFRGGFGGWVTFQFFVNTTKGYTKRLKYFHGAGGGGPVTRGVIQSNRQAVYLPDADIVVNGHTHDSWYVPIARERITTKGLINHDLAHHIRLASYKDEYATGADGYQVERWAPPKPIGAAWLRFYLDSKQEIQFDVMSAVV